jgi:hypothetical protein
MAPRRFFLFLLPALFAGLLLAACGDDDTQSGSPTPTQAPPGTTTPTPEANTPEGFLQALREFNRELSSGRVDPFISRAKVVDYTCKATDVQGGEGAVHACKTVGEVVRGVGTSTWRSSGTLTKVEDFVANLQGLQVNFDTAKSDEFGPGTLRVFAYDDTKHSAVVTVISKCLPQYQCPGTGVQRLVWVPQFEYVDGAWKIERLMYAFVLGEEFLEADAEGSNIYLPDWKPMQ